MSVDARGGGPRPGKSPRRMGPGWRRLPTAARAARRPHRADCQNLAKLRTPPDAPRHRAAAAGRTTPRRPAEGAPPRLAMKVAATPLEAAKNPIEMGDRFHHVLFDTADALVQVVGNLRIGEAFKPVAQENLARFRLQGA